MILPRRVFQGFPHVRTMPASTTGRTRDPAQRGPTTDLRHRGLRVNGRGPYPPPRDGPPGPAWLGGGETSRHRGTRQLSHHCHLRPSELPGQRSIQLPGCPLVSVTSICRKSTSLTMASRCAGWGPQGHAGYLDRTVQEQSRSRPMPLSHPYDSRGLGRPEVTVNPVFTREPVRIPRDRLSEGGLDPETAYQVVHDELMLDGNARLNLATFVTTWMEPTAERLMGECAEKNMIDKDEY